MLCVVRDEVRHRGELDSLFKVVYLPLSICCHSVANYLQVVSVRETNDGVRKQKVQLYFVACLPLPPSCEHTLQRSSISCLLLGKKVGDVAIRMYVYVQHTRNLYARKNVQVIRARGVSGEALFHVYECLKPRVVFEYKGSRAVEYSTNTC